MKKRVKRSVPKSRKKQPPSSPPPLSKDFISMEALYHAYRKAKVDVYYERSQPMSVAFCEYEISLDENLHSLQEKLTRPGSNWYRNIDFIGDHGFIPKGLQIPAIDDSGSDQSHFGVSDPEDAWDLLLESLREDQSSLKAEFRPVALYTVDMYVVCALWVNLVGHLFDACLDRSARGSRLRRLRPDETGDSQVGEYHLMATGSFTPYFHSYREWRENGLNSIRRELKEDRKVIAITMDLKAFYHNVDPRFLIRQSFLKAINFTNINGRDLTPEEKEFTTQVLKAFIKWARSLPHLGNSDPPGLPVGPSAPRIIANVILAEFDRQAQESLDPIYYARYVDDIFLVLRDNGSLRSPVQVLKHLCNRIKPLVGNNDYSLLTLDFPYASGCKLQFQAKKQRIFLLSGEIGTDLLDTIESQIDSVSSEWRLLPDLDSLEKSPAAKVLTASTQLSEDADTLRKADKLSLKRLSFSIMLSQYDSLANDLPPEEWARERNRFYRFAERHVLTTLRILDLNDYLPRLIGLTVYCKDWDIARRLVRRISESVGSLKATIHQDSSTKTVDQWNGYIRHLQTALKEAAIRSYPNDAESPSTDAEVRTILAGIDALSDSTNDDPQEIGEFSRKLFWADLGRQPFKYALLGYISLPECTLPNIKRKLPKSQSNRYQTIFNFLSGRTKPRAKVRPLLLSTRPLSPREITELDAECVTNLDRLSKLVVSLRGNWVKPVQALPSHPELSDAHDSEVSRIVIGETSFWPPTRIALTSFLIKDKSWMKAAAGKPDLSLARYKRLVRMANAVVTSRPHADYVVFPELAIPRRWLPGLANVFMKAGISLVTGVEYRPSQTAPDSVVNEAYLFLKDDRLGYQSWCVARQQKGVPAHHERDELRKKHDLTLEPPSPASSTKPIYRHFGHNFGVLICSELTDIRFRQEMRGNVDTVFVLSWNQDLESFSSLVESAALDVHCFMVMVNNRQYGDSRVRGPYKMHWQRDQVRVKGGLDDYFVVTDLNISALRKYQSHKEPPLGDKSKFKPTPEGFNIAADRKQIEFDEITWPT